MAKVDLHVHSHFSDSPKIYILAKAESRECYTPPEEVYRRARARGMDLVTITDHDTIDGCLEIAHHGDHVFLSEEVSARFPDNGCIVHVLTYDITEAQHDEMQRLRYNVYDLVDYMRAEDILHVLAHPLSSVNHRLRREHLEQCFVMFDNIELLNGPRDPYHRVALERITGAITRETIEQWANEYDLTPARLEPSFGFTGGSDDHSGLAIARAYTEFEGPATVANMRAAILERRSRPEGAIMTPVSAAHNIYSGVVQYYMDRQSKKGTDSIYANLAEAASTGGASLAKLGDLSQLMETPIGRVVLALQAVSSEHSLPTLDRMLEEGATEELQQELHTIATKVMRQALGNEAEQMIKGIGELDFDLLAKTLPRILQMLLLNVPYYIGYRYFYQDRVRAQALHESMGLGFVPKESPAVAIFVDTLENVNGVTIGLRRMIKELRQQNKTVYLLGLKIDTANGTADGVDDLGDLDVASVILFDPLASFPIPGYDPDGLDAAHRTRLGVPPLLEMMKWCVENQIDLIQASTPGPVGLAGLTIGKLLGTPIVGHYHTQVPEYAQRLLGDKNIAAVVRAYVSWFYGSLDKVIVPSQATKDNLVGMGIQAHKICQLARGVDAETFNPRYRNKKIWERYGLNGAKKLLYVGRVSREKNLDVLFDAFDQLKENGVPVELGIVGDGPYRSNLEEKAKNLPGVIFTGYVAGQELSELFASADLFVFPSATDTFGNVVLEAQASSLPCIVTDEGGPSELVVHNRTGMIVPADSSHALTDAINRLVADDDLRRTMADNARQHASRMSHDAAANQLWDFYTSHIASERELLTRTVEQGI